VANTKKKKTGKSNTRRTASSSKGRRTYNKTPQKRKRTAEEIAIIAEVCMWIALAVGIFLFLSNFGVCGVVGDAVSYFMFGTFGVMAYIFPIALFGVTAFIASNIGNRGVWVRVTASVVLFTNLCVFAHMLLMDVDKVQSIVDLYTYCGKEHTGGGFMGGIIGTGLVKMIGLVGTYIISILILIITTVLFTQKSLINGVKNYGEQAYSSAKEDYDTLREVREQERIRRERERAKKQKRTFFKGVDFDETTISEKSESAKVKDVKEIKPDIKITGIEPSYSGPIDINEESDGQYTYIEVRDKSGRPKKTKEPEVQYEDKGVDGDFSPNERIEVSKEAKKTMARKPYGAGGNLVESGNNTDSSDNTDETFVMPKTHKKIRYAKPKLDLLNRNAGGRANVSRSELMDTANKLQQILKEFGVNVTVTNVSRGPSVTRYELQPEMGTKVSKITALTDDIKLNLAASDIRIEAPIPGKAAVGIEVPNNGRDTVGIRELIESKELRETESKIAFAAGKDISGKVIVADIAKMPHMLVAGTTGSGKSVFTNSIIMSILYRATPEEVKLIIIDPKVVEFGIYNGIPHLMTPVVTDPKKAAGALNWAVAEMSERYKKFAQTGTRDLKGYNEKISSGEFVDDEEHEKLPQIVIIIDELADLMMVAAKDVEDAICRLAQLARAAGIHLIIATQRPSVDVVTGLIKANIPSRVALLVSSGVDSRTIIDMNGAEKLLGNGDMLFYPSGYVKPVRVQGAFVSDEEVKRTVDYLVEQNEQVEYNTTLETKMVADTEAGEDAGDDGRDAYFKEAARLVIEKEKGSTSMIQRTFRVGFNRAARIMEQLYDAGIVGQEETNKPRRVLMSMEQFEIEFGDGDNDWQE